MSNLEFCNKKQTPEAANENQSGSNSHLKPDSSASFEFLQNTYPNNTFVLTAISDKGTETKAFLLGSEDECKAWIEDRNGVKGYNIYFTLNRTNYTDKKPAERDMTHMAFCHVDIDPAGTGDIADERSEIYGKLTSALPSDVPTPSIIVDSGNGYQAFWRLTDPVKTGVDMLGDDAGLNAEILDRIDDLKRYNIWLEEIFSADACHNLDRLCRLPGTINWPNKTKLAKGRVPVLAKLIESNDKTYTLSDFKKGAPKQATPQNAASIHKPANVDIASIKPFELNTLPNEVANWCPQVIQYGQHPDDEKYQYDTRSEALFAVVCELVRAGCDDRTIAAVITDPRHAISESVNERKDKQRYVNRQITRARDFCDEPWLPKWNDRYAIIQNCRPAARVMEILSDHELGGTEVTYKSFADLRNAHLHETMAVDIDGKPKTLQLADVWLRHKRARRYRQVAFYPNKELPGDVLNLWQGFAVKPEEGDCSLILAHIRDNICGANDEAYKYMLGWLARLVQYPEKMGEVAVILRSGKGTGKSFFADIIGSMFGEHYTTISNSDHLTGRFNAHLQRCVLLFADEAFFAGDKKGEGTLKSIVTDSRIFVEPKGIDGSMRRNFLHIIMASNNKWVVPSSHDERRFFVLDVANDQKQNTDYFSALAKQVANGGREAFLQFLLNYDLSGFNVRKVPQTDGLQAQKAESLRRNPVLKVLYDCLQTGDFPMFVNNKKCRFERTGKWLIGTTGFQAYVKDQVGRAEPTLNEIGELFISMGLIRNERGSPIGYELPSLIETRRAFDEIQSPMSWNEDVTEWGFESDCQDEVDEPTQSEIPF